MAYFIKIKNLLYWKKMNNYDYNLLNGNLSRCT